VGQDLTLRPLSRAMAACVAAALVLWAYRLSTDGQPGRALAFSLVTGAAFGVVLQRARFCFFCVTRDFLVWRDARGLVGIVLAMLVGTLGYHAVFGAFLPIPADGRLPPGAHIGPISIVLAAGAFVFGVGMTLSGSCISAHLYRLGEGATGSVLALLGAAAGFVLGFLSWNALYASIIRDAPVLWLPHTLGYGGTVLLQTGVLLVIIHVLLKWHRVRHDPPARQPGAGHPAGSIGPVTLYTVLFAQRWPAYVGGVLIGLLATLAYFRSGALGVTAELGSLARTTADALQLLPARLDGLDTFAGCATVVKQAMLSPNGVFVTGLVLASWISAMLAREFKLQPVRLDEALRKIIGGILMGFGAMISLGCTVGVLLSGVMAGALSGWVFALFCLLGLYGTLKVQAWAGRGVA